MKKTEQPYILVFGISIYDIFGFTNQGYRTHDSNPGKVKVSFGGVCRNIAENLGRIGTTTNFISVVGDDEKGRSMISHAKSANFDMTDSLVVSGESTPTYMAILDEHGEMVSAIVDVTIADYLTPEFVDERVDVIENSEYMIFGSDNPETLEYILKKFHGKTKFVLDPVSAAKAKTLTHLIPYFHTIKPNRHEAEALVGFEIKTQEDLKKAGAFFLGQGVSKIFISLDADGVYYNDGIEEGIIKTSNVDVVNVTGAGDAFLAGVGYGYMNELSVIETVKFAQMMSIITISHEDTIHPNLTEAFIKSEMMRYEWEVTDLKQK